METRHGGDWPIGRHDAFGMSELLARTLGRNGLIELLILACVAALLAGCASGQYESQPLAGHAFLDRAISKTMGSLVVSTSVPDAEETLALTGLDLYEQGIQPVWLQVENQGDTRARVVTWSIDKEYFSPIEVAYMNRKQFSKKAYREMERWFHESGMPRFIQAGEKRSGLVFTHLRPGTKGFNLTLISDKMAHEFTFFVPLPGFVADFMEVDFDSLYAESERIDGDPEGIKSILENELSCCATDTTGSLEGAPLNVVLVGTGTAVRRAMLRGDWLETSAEEDVAVRSRKQRYRGRRPDAIFSRIRPDGNERIQLSLWMAPWLIDGEPVWLGTAFYFTEEQSMLSMLSDHDSEDHTLPALFARESVTADIDSAQRYLFQNLWYNGSLRRAGFVEGVGKAPVDEPRTAFGGASYFTDGLRLVVFLSEEPMALDEGRFIYDRRTGAAAGDGEQAAQPFRGAQVPPPNDRLHEQTDGSLRISTAVPSADETRTIFEMDLYSKNVQPVWVQVENSGDSNLYLTPMGLDPSYFTARETANRSRSTISVPVSEKFEQRSRTTMSVPPRSIQSGYIFTRVDEGTKSFNVDVIGDGKAHLMSFFVPVPGLKLDHYEIDFDALYGDTELKNADLETLVAELETMPCCVRDEKGKDKGDPLNLVFIGDTKDLFYALMRAGWDETETIHGASLWKTAASAVSGSRYRYSPVSALYVFGRSQDAALQRSRTSIHERNHLRVWLTPLRFEGKPVWIGQISRDIGVHLAWRTITTHKIDPDVDETREFLLEDLAFAQAVQGFGYVGGVGPAGYDKPRGNLTGDPYFTDGQRVVIWLSAEPVGFDEIEVRDLSSYQTGAIGP